MRPALWTRVAHATMLSPREGMERDTTSPASPPTLQLIGRARAGDREAYDRLFALAFERARLFVRMRLGPTLRTRLDSKDVLQEAYVEAHRAFERFEYRGPGSFTKWLCRIIENRIRGLADHHGARKRTPPGAMARVSRIAHQLETSTEGPATQVARREANERLLAGVDALPEAQREVLLLRFFQDLTIDEIASLTGHSPTTTRRLLGRAAMALGAALGGAP